MENVPQSHEFTWSFDELDLEGAFEQLSENINEVLTIYKYVVDQYCALPTEKNDTEIYKFLKSESDRFDIEFKRLVSTRKSLMKIKRWKN